MILINLLHNFQLLLCIICSVHLQVDLDIQGTPAKIERDLN
jgi:hypothetical protein